MDKNAIKKYAVWARRELISRVSQKAMQFGITEKNIVDASADSVNGHLLSPAEKRQRQALIAKIKDEGYEMVCEEVAYTWFNRFIALRFMEVNGYLPSRVRVFTDENNAFKPQILAEAIHLEMDGLKMEKVYIFKDANQTDELYKYLIITQCNALNSILPGMFQRIEDYTELLFPDNILREGSAIEQMISQISEDDWKDAVQIIGWLYQYYNTEPKDKVFADLKKNIKISKENIPAATQLFTPDWIVRYMVENSLGRLWAEGHPNDELKAGWKYYLEESVQEPDVQKQLAIIREEYKALTPDQIKCIDPCMGSGHILAYMFDVLMHIYEAYGYTSREAVASIINNNLYGLDIDDRAAQLAYFSVMMKARQYDSRFFSRKLQPHVYAICESNGISTDAVDSFCKGDVEQKKAMKTIIDELHDAKEYGSILTVTLEDWAALYVRFDKIRNEHVIDIYHDMVMNELLPLVQVAEVLSQKYHAVVTNPPYMGSSGMSPKLSEYVNHNYNYCKADMFSVFVDKCRKFSFHKGFYAMITQPSLLFLASFEKLRQQIVSGQCIDSLLHLGRGIFGIDFGSTAFVIRNAKTDSFVGNYFRLHSRTFQYIDPDDIETLYLNTVVDHAYKYDFSTYNTKTFSDMVEVEVEEDSEPTESKLQRLYYSANQCNFLLFPDAPIAYWAGENVFAAFNHKKTIRDIAYPCEGIKTGDNERFLRYWFEVADINTSIQKPISDAKWCKMAKGGPYRRWYGNLEYVVNWASNGIELKNFKKSTVSNEQLFFSDAITWSYISAGKISMRCIGNDVLYNNKGPACYCNKNDKFYLLGLSNSVVFNYILGFWAPTMDYKPGNISPFPFIECQEKKDVVSIYSNECVELSKEDWNSFEVSWDFIRHPLAFTQRERDEQMSYGIHCLERIESVTLIEKRFLYWARDCEGRFTMLRRNEEELNRIFIDIYSLQDELSQEVEDKDVTVRKADLGRDIRSFISYAVGCMFGRYSLDVDGLAYAGGEWDYSKYASFPADKDNIIPICDDEYFDDDIVGRFVKFVEIVYGKETLDWNLRFIADALGGSGSSKDIIRNYFINDFYADHLKIYQKHPIYWLFESGKKGGFKALIYMHRYQPDTIARMRTDYVHEQQARYRTALADLEQRIVGASTGERVKLNKQFAKLQAQDAEIREYEEKIHHLADQMIRIDLDDGVKYNYEIFKDVLAPIK